MAGKARVHELAKELGVTSKEVLAKLKEQGEFVKSASSTVEAPVARRLRDAFIARDGKSGGRPGGRKPAPGSLSQQIDRQVDAARNRLTALEDIAQSAKALYASLSPEQRPAADPRLANLMTIPVAQPQDGQRAQRER